MNKVQKYIVAFVISITIPTIFLFSVKDIKYTPKETTPECCDMTYELSGKGWPLPMYITTSGGFTGETSTDIVWRNIIIEFSVIFLVSFLLSIVVLNKKSS